MGAPPPYVIIDAIVGNEHTTRVRHKTDQSFWSNNHLLGAAGKLFRSRDGR